jgi:hypothetical protein
LRKSGNLKERFKATATLFSVLWNPRQTKFTSNEGAKQIETMELTEIPMTYSSFSLPTILAILFPKKNKEKITTRTSVIPIPANSLDSNLSKISPDPSTYTKSSQTSAKKRERKHNLQTGNCHSPKNQEKTPAEPLQKSPNFPLFS